MKRRPLYLRPAAKAASKMRRFTSSLAAYGGGHIPLPERTLDRFISFLGPLQLPAGQLLWLVLLLAAVAIVSRAHYTADLSAFLPRTPTLTQRLLVDQLRQGLASRLITVAIEGADPQTRAKLSAGVAQRLKGDARFAAVSNGDAAALLNDERFLLEHRYLLSAEVTPERFSPQGLRTAIGDTLDLLASPAGMLAKSLLPRDPTGEMVQIIDQLGGTAPPRTQAGLWSSRDGERALLLAQTSAQGSDTDAQERAIKAIQGAFAAATADLPAPAHGGVRLQMTGPPVFAVESRDRIKSEVIRLSGVSTLLVVILLFAVYRSLPALALGLVPVATGALAGVAAVQLGFGVVHGITLGFGITLIGEAVDYSIYLFIQARERAQPGDWQRSVWPTIRLGMLASVCGFASLLPSGFPGLAQLGLYSIAGLLAGAAVTRFVLPRWLPAKLATRELAPLGTCFARLAQQAAPARPFLLLVPLLAGTILYVHRDTLWNRELSALSPIPQAQQDLDAQLHADLGAPDPGYLIALSGADSESVLEDAERAGLRLEQLADTGVIGGFTSPAFYLPSLTAQQRRRASLPDEAQLREHLSQALAGLPVRAKRLEPFIKEVQAARSEPFITRSDLARTSLGAAVEALLFPGEGRWHALLPLKAPSSRADIDTGRVQQALLGLPGEPVVLAVKREADKLYATYLTEAVGFSLLGFGAIIILLAITLGRPARVLRVVTPLVLAVLTVAAGLALIGQPLTILHVIGMLLIVAVGSNYALFFDRRAEQSGEGSVPLTWASLLVANLATVMTFGVLACSSVPVLAALGMTVAPGTLLALLFSALLARHPPLPASSSRPAGSRRPASST
jgi:predicted exporter